ncbi:wax ester/triacylglycerol synthase family O-acyltransferase [Phycicoccus ginsengisoli]
MRVDRLTADDRIVLWMDATWAQDVGVVAVLEGGPLLDTGGDIRLDEVRAAVGRRLHVLPRSRQVLLTPPRGLGWPLWVDDPSFDVRRHVREAHVPAPGGYAELLATVERLRRRRLDAALPLWQVWLLPGLADGRVGLFLRLHHVVADGMAGLATLAALLDPGEDRGAAPHPWVLRDRPTPTELFLDNVRRAGESIRRASTWVRRPGRSLRSLRAAGPATRELMTGPPGPRTSLDGVIGQDRALAVAACDLADVTTVAKAHGATVNDVLLAMIAGGLRSLLLSRGEDVQGLELPVDVPTSLRRGHEDRPQGNDISQITVRLPVGLPHPEARLRRITSAMTRRKALTRPSLGTTFRSRVVSRYLLKLVIRQRVNVTSADLVGPTSRLRLAGAEVLELFPLVNLVGNVTLGVGAMSYAGRFDLLVVADAALQPDVDVVAAGALEELRALMGAHAQQAGSR